MPEPENDNFELDDEMLGDEDTGPKTYSVKIDGVTQTLTEEQLIKMAELGGGAQKRFDEAAEIKRNASGAKRLQDLMQKLNASASEVTTFELEEIARLQGIKGGKVDEFVQSVKQAVAYMEGEGDEMPKEFVDESSTATTPISKSSKVSLDSLDPDLRDMILQNQQDGRERRVSDYRKEMYEDLEKRLDNDDYLGKIVKGNADRREAILDAIRNEMTRRVAIGQEDGHQLRDKVLQTVVTRFKKLGVGVQSGDPTNALDKTLAAMGPADNPQLAAAALKDDSKPLERIPVGDARRESNFAARFIQKLKQRSS